MLLSASWLREEKAPIASIVAPLPPVLVPPPPMAVVPTAAPALLSIFLAGKSAQTLRAYGQDLGDFAGFLGAESPQEAASILLGRGPGEANAIALSYRSHLLDRGLSPATVNRRLAALRSLVRLARTLGLVQFTLEAPSVLQEAYRDTRGPGREGFVLLLRELERRGDRKAVRDTALIRLLFDLALRRAESVGLDLEDVDLEAGTVAVLGKGRREKQLITLPPETTAALAAWLEVRGEEPGPLFTNFDRARKGRRLQGGSVARILAALGREVGLTVRPHGLRHAAITTALDLTGGDVRWVQRFSRHRDLRTLNRYDDNRQDLAGEVARRVAAGT